jgi:hypothetical protein
LDGLCVIFSAFTRRLGTDFTVSVVGWTPMADFRKNMICMIVALVEAMNHPGGRTSTLA